VNWFDRIVCEFPLPDPSDQDREFVTRDFGGWGRGRYTITRDGRLIRHALARRQALEPVKDIEWPIDGEIRIVDDDVRESESAVEYAVRFRNGRVEWIRRVMLEGSGVPGPASPWVLPEFRPEPMGKPASSEEFRSAIPERLELVEGHIAGEGRLVMSLLATMGLRRVAALVGREAWLSAVEDRT
jgi:hypothetical protein